VRDFPSPPAKQGLFQKIFGSKPTFEGAGSQQLIDLIELLGTTAEPSSDSFFRATAKQLAHVLGVSHCVLSEIIESEPTKLRMLAHFRGGGIRPNEEYFSAGKPSEMVLRQGVYYQESGLVKLFPEDETLDVLVDGCCLGVTIPGLDGKPIGHLSIFDRYPLKAPDFSEKVLRFFASRASAEIIRRQAVESSREALDNLEVFSDEFPGWALAYFDYLSGDREITFSNQRCDDILGPKTAAAVLADPTIYRSLIHPDDLTEIVRRSVRARATNGHLNADYRVRGDDGKFKWVRVHARYSGSSDQVKMVHCLTTSIEDERRLTRHAEELSRQVSILIEAVPMAVVLRDSGGMIQFMNGSAQEFLSLQSQDWPNQSFASLEVANPGAGEGLRAIASMDQAAWMSKERIDRQIQLQVDPPRTLDCSWVPLFDSDGERLGLVTTLRDVTVAVQEQREREQMQEADRRMDALGRLAEGISHEFENLLTAVLGYSDICLSRLHADDDNSLRMKGSLEKIRTAAGKASGLARSLLAFSARKHWKGDRCEPAEIIREFAPSLSHLAGPQVVLETDIHNADGTVPLSREDLADIMVHLVSNARDAVDGMGTIRLAGSIRLSDQPLTWRNQTLPAGKYYLMEIEDNGVGIAEADLGHIFDPFFTTSAAVRGRGMGLAMVFGLVKKSGGGIHVQSSVGGGTCMQVYLPLTIQPSGGTMADSDGNLSILVVEDQVSLLELFREVLEAGGHQTLSATTIAEAIKIATEAEKVDLLVCDIFLSDGNGTELFKKIQDLVGPLPVLFFSGTPRSNLEAQGIELPENAPLLSKPFRPTQLLQTIARMRGR
jgi:signal transduction histidine kinase/CheY-like chemotaxis protein